MLIDANIFLEVLLDQKRATACLALLERIQRGERSACVSFFTIDSVLLAMERHNKNPAEMLAFLNSIGSSAGMRVYAPTLLDRRYALRHIRSLGLDFEDALTLQCALSNKLKEIASFDKHFDKAGMIHRIEP